MKMYYSVCYLSVAAENLSEEQIDELFEYTAMRNNECQVSGILLHSIGRFFQVLEGNEDYVKDLFNRIQKDKRHDDILILFEGKTAHPLFLKYNSKFNLLKTTDDLKRIEAYLNANQTHPTTDRVKRILEPFLLMGMD